MQTAEIDVDAATALFDDHWPKLRASVRQYVRRKAIPWDKGEDMLSLGCYRLWKQCVRQTFGGKPVAKQWKIWWLWNDVQKAYDKPDVEQFDEQQHTLQIRKQH